MRDEEAPQSWWYHSIYLHFPSEVTLAAGRETQKIIYRLGGAEAKSAGTRQAERLAHCIIPAGPRAEEARQMLSEMLLDDAVKQGSAGRPAQNAKGADSTGDRPAAQCLHLDHVYVGEICVSLNGETSCGPRFRWECADEGGGEGGGGGGNGGGGDGDGGGGGGGDGEEWPDEDSDGDEEDPECIEEGEDDGEGGGDGDEGGGGEENPPGPGGECPPEEPPPPPPPPAPEEQLETMLEENEFALLEDIDCELVAGSLDLAAHIPPESVVFRLEDLQENHTDFIDRAFGGEYAMQSIFDAEGAVVNMDHFSVTVTDLPPGMTPEGMLGHVRRSINDFIDNSISEFDAYPDLPGDWGDWFSDDPLGTILSIDLRGPGGILVNEGSVVTSHHDADDWIFSTIRTPADWNHPVSGNREFGFKTHSNGDVSIYTRGVDRVTSGFDRWQQRVTNAVGFDVVFNKGDELWASFLEGIVGYVEQSGGQAVNNGNTGDRVDWEDVADVLSGEREASSLEGCGGG